ncbi:hypothetical protein EHS25_006753 [Saitozyma podzolica]|uniref:Chitin-binding type-2 domain-containing protein n=1 Tax=Saitozyma podzolica TaxID=1890683 RepID=A0A427YSP5_9TREE|nr:hypothetical protein EHS25_006753 [Saitozyma podzolica]
MRTTTISLALLALALVDVIVASPIIGTAVVRALLAKRSARRRNVDHDCYVSPPVERVNVTEHKCSRDGGFLGSSVSNSRGQYHCPPTQYDVSLSAFPSFQNYADYTAVGCTYADLVCWYRTDNGELINDDSQECEFGEAPWAGCGARFTNDPIYFKRDLPREIRERTAEAKVLDRRQVDPATLGRGL